MAFEQPWEDPAEPNEPEQPYPPTLFSPGWHFSENGQYIEANWAEDAIAEKPINSKITLLLSMETNQIVGIRLFGVCPTIRRRK